jgi:hypothetical protein
MNTKLTTKNFLITILSIILVLLVIFFIVMSKIKENRERDNQFNVSNFEECVAAGNPVMESYPRQCRHGEESFSEDIGQIVGGDKDEHGCIGSAGYSWCEPKNECLRVWEEKCYANIEEEIQYFLANKYSKSTEEVIVNITKQIESHVAGSVKFGPEVSAGGLFLAVQFGNMWEVVYDGNGSIDCEKMRIEYNFPDEILKPNFCD